jgi:hypothetical protein
MYDQRRFRVLLPRHEQTSRRHDNKSYRGGQGRQTPLALNDADRPAHRNDPALARLQLSIDERMDA